jgi:hypothetical protein
MQRYIKYARAIKPVLTEPAQAALVRSYKRLRSEDAVPGSQSAYRITVRQLEALVRLSEAMARVFCSSEVRVEHVQEVRAGEGCGCCWCWAKGDWVWRAVAPAVTQLVLLLLLPLAGTLLAVGGEMACPSLGCALDLPPTLPPTTSRCCPRCKKRAPPGDPPAAVLHPED